jgi:chloride channel 3/4/5
MTGADENSPLLDTERPSDRRLSRLIQKDDAASSIVKSHASVDEQALADSTIGERLAYNDYTTIDWLHDLVSVSTLIFALLPW